MTNTNELQTPVSGDVQQAVNALADAAAIAQHELAQATADTKNGVLMAIADALDAHASDIADANAMDMQAAFDAGMDQGKLDRLKFDVIRVAAAAQGVRHVATLPDPVGEIVRGYDLGNGLRLLQVIDEVLQELHFDPALVASVDRYGREGARAMMRATGHIDVLIPRGGAGLIQSVVHESRVPVIETGAGNVHIYVDSSADIDKAIDIVVNAKTQRVGVCNAAEKLIVHRDIARQFLPRMAQALARAHVTIHADELSMRIMGDADIKDIQLLAADEADWGTEYLALEIGVRIVDSLDEAIDHINRYSTHHTESILSQDYTNIERFTKAIDSAVVMVNASTRFTDGGVFGFGAELGISTQKLHARGPMGLQEMTTTKWVGYGNGQVRA